MAYGDKADPGVAEDEARPESEGKVGKAPDAEILKRFKLAIDSTSENRVFQQQDIQFAAASPDKPEWQWPANVLKQRMGTDGVYARPTLTLNKLPQHIQLVTNEQRQNRPAIKVLPVDDKADKEVAEVLNGVVRHIEANSDADVAYDTAAENQVRMGEGYWRILTDYCDEKSFDQEIYISPIKNSFSVYLDPDGLRKDSTGRFCEWGFITDKIPKNSFTKSFPKATATNWDQLGRGDDTAGWADSEHVVIAEYFCIKDKKAKLVQWADGSVTVDGEMPKVAGLAPMLDDAGKPVTRETTIKKVMWEKMTGLEVLEEREWAGKYIPIVRVVGNEAEVDGKVYVWGIVRPAKDACRMFNYWKSQEAEMLALAPKAPFMAPVEAIETFEDLYKTANYVNHPYLPYNAFNESGEPIPKPERSIPVMPSPGIIQAALGASDDIQATVGQYNPSIGAEAKEKSGKAIIARQRQADIGTFHYIDNLARSIRQTGRIIIDLIPKIYDTRRVARILGEDGEPGHVTLDPNAPKPYEKVETVNGIEEIYNPTIGQYDVRVTVGPSYTTKRQEAAEFMAQVLQGNKELMSVMGDLYFGMLDVPGADEIAKRLKKTIPPNLAEDEEEEGQVIQTPEGPLPVAQAGAAIESLMQQITMLGEELKKADANGKEAELLKAKATLYDAETRRMQAETHVNDTASKVSERQFQKTMEYVDRTKVDDTELLAPGKQPAAVE